MHTSENKILTETTVTRCEAPVEIVTVLQLNVVALDESENTFLDVPENEELLLIAVLLICEVFFVYDLEAQLYEL